jgi:ParB family chromosome partitioning protein
VPAAAIEPARYGAGAVFECPIERISPRSDQPRRRMDKERLAELAASIREHGIIEPIVVRRSGPGADRFEIIAGERRWLACQRAGLKAVPVVVKDVTPDAAFELALVENLQREDLNPLEVAEAYERLLRPDGVTQQDVATRVGKSRVAVANALRLLKLPERIRALVHDDRLSEGHARALLGAPDEATMLAIAEKAMRGKLSVRQVERLARAAKRRRDGAPPPSPGAGSGKTPAIRDLELRLARRLGARTEVRHAGQAGTLTIHYGSLDELDRILELIQA